MRNNRPLVKPAPIGGRLERQFGWVAKFPLVWLATVYFKIKNSTLDTEDGYLRHQKEFFAIAFLRNKSDKFYKVRKKIAEYALDGTSTKALDIGTGHGFQAKELLDAGIPEIFAIDVVPGRIDYCKQLYQDTRIKFQVMDATKLLFPDKYFDCATVSAVLYDMPAAARRKAISELARVTKNLIVIFEPRTFKNPVKAFIYGIIGEIVDESLNFKEYVEDDLAKLLHDHNLKIIKDENVLHGIMNIKVCKPENCKYHPSV